MNKEAIKKLEEYCKWCTAQGGQCLLNLSGCAVGDARAILKEQPNCEGCEFFKHSNKFHHCWRYTQETSLCKLRQPVEQPSASSLTERLRLNFKDEVFFKTNWPQSHFREMMKVDVLKACTRLDRSEASRKDLLTACKAIVVFCEEKKRLELDGICPTKAYELAKAAIAKEKEGGE